MEPDEIKIGDVVSKGTRLWTAITDSHNGVFTAADEDGNITMLAVSEVLLVRIATSPE